MLNNIHDRLARLVVSLHQPKREPVGVPHGLVHVEIRVGRVFYDGIVRQMREFVVDVRHRVRMAGEAQIRVLEEPRADLRGKAGHHHPLPDVEFSVADDHRPLDVFLDEPFVRAETIGSGFAPDRAQGGENVVQRCGVAREQPVRVAETAERRTPGVPEDVVQILYDTDASATIRVGRLWGKIEDFFVQLPLRNR